jgi:SAM-dependent methyltransferase
MTDGPHEPVVESAPLAHRIAPRLCAPDPRTGETCAWYHGVWQYLRVMGLAKTCGGQTAFFIENLRSLARARSWPRVFVSGTADYSMPAHVLFAYASEGAPVALTVLDACETPLYLSRWYAERVGVPAATTRSDVLTYASAIQFDVVMTNSFLGYFDETARARLVAAWWQVLRPGGKVIFTHRLRPGAGTSPVGFSTEQARAFSEAARRSAERWQATFGFDPDDVAGWVRTYAQRHRTYPVRSADEIASLVRDAGFSLDRLDVVTTAAPAGGSLVSGPTLAEKADYVRVVATRL